jgi:hypothetical protein
VFIEAPKVEVGTATVIATTNRGLNAEEWVELALNRIVSISNDAPMPIREQAHMFREQLKGVLLFYFKRVARCERVTVANLLRAEGFPVLADKIVDID